MAFLKFMGWWLFVGVMIIWPIYLIWTGHKERRE